MYVRNYLVRNPSVPPPTETMTESLSEWTLEKAETPKH